METREYSGLGPDASRSNSRLCYPDFGRLAGNRTGCKRLSPVEWEDCTILCDCTFRNYLLVRPEGAQGEVQASSDAVFLLFHAISHAEEVAICR